MSEHKQFVVRQGHDVDRFLRLELIGELHLATGAELEARLAQLEPEALVSRVARMLHTRRRADRPEATARSVAGRP